MLAKAHNVCFKLFSTERWTIQSRSVPLGMLTCFSVEITLVKCYRQSVPCPCCIYKLYLAHFFLCVISLLQSWDHLPSVDSFHQPPFLSLEQGHLGHAHKLELLTTDNSLCLPVNLFTHFKSFQNPSSVSFFGKHMYRHVNKEQKYLGRTLVEQLMVFICR